MLLCRRFGPFHLSNYPRLLVAHKYSIFSAQLCRDWFQPLASPPSPSWDWIRIRLYWKQQRGMHFSTARIVTGGSELPAYTRRDRGSNVTLMQFNINLEFPVLVPLCFIFFSHQLFTVRRSLIIQHHVS